MEILSFSAVHFFHGTLCPDGDMFSFADRALVKVFIRIEPDGIHVLLTVPAVESHYSAILREFFFSFLECRDIYKVVIGSHSNWVLKIIIIPYGEDFPRISKFCRPFPVECMAAFPPLRREMLYT